MGKLKGDDGKSAIVFVDAALGLTPGDQLELQVSFWCDAVAPWSLKHMPSSSGGSYMLGSITDSDDIEFERRELHRNLTLKAGKPDPGNPQQITIAYAIDGVPGTIRCRFHRVGYMDVDVIDGPLTYDNAHAWAERMRKLPATDP
jgi:hypothetical protein